MISTVPSVRTSAAGDGALLSGLDADGLGLLGFGADHEALDVEDDIGNVLNDAGNGAELVQHPVDLDD